MCVESAEIELAQNGLAPLLVMIDVFWLQAALSRHHRLPVESEQQEENKMKSSKKNLEETVIYTRPNC